MKPFFKVILSLLLSAISIAEVEAAKPKKQPADTVALPCRGVMETFSRVSDDIESRLDFYRSEGLTHYFYCPSDDRYCNRWGWKFLYNDSERRDLMKLRDLCARKGLDFVWTLNPGERYSWTEEDYKFLLDKLVMMYYSGFRSFAVDFTENRGDHHSLRDSLDMHFVNVMKQKVSLHLIDDIPQLKYPSEGTTAVESFMRGYHFDETFRRTAKSVGAMICNLSSYDEFAKFAVISSADCARNPMNYSADQSLADAIELLHGDVRDAFMTFLRHTGTVNESSEVEAFCLSDWSKEKSETLFAEFDRIESVATVLGKNMESSILEALQPWFVQFGRLGTRGKKVLKCMEYFSRGNIRDFWTVYISAVMSEQEQLDYQAHPVGQEKLHPFCVQSMQELKDAFTDMLTGGAGLRNLSSTLAAHSTPALDSDFSTSVSSSGHIEFAIPAEANTCHLLMGPLSKDKKVYFRQLKTDGSLAAEFVVDSPSMTFDIKNGAVKVDVLGDVDIYECIFVYL